MSFITFSSTINWTCQSSRQGVKPYAKERHCAEKVISALFTFTPNVVFGKYCIYPKGFITVRTGWVIC